METPPAIEPEITRRIWTELQRATQDRHHEWRTPVLATIGTDGLPQARTVVLRQADAKRHQLQIYTDSRSPKVAELTANPAASLVFWSKRLSWQLRVRAVTSVQFNGTEVNEVWTRVSQTAAAGDYLSASAPGANLPPKEVGHADEKASQQQHCLAIVTAQVQEMDWLELARSGHRRAVMGAGVWTWRVP